MFGRTKIRGRGVLVLLLRNEGKFWCKAPCRCFLVDGCRYFLVGDAVSQFGYGHMLHPLPREEQCRQGRKEDTTQKKRQCATVLCLRVNQLLQLGRIC